HPDGWFRRPRRGRRRPGRVLQEGRGPPAAPRRDRGARERQAVSTFTFGEVGITRVVEIPRSAYPTASMLAEPTPAAIARHDAWLRPDFYDATTGDLGSRIQT